MPSADYGDTPSFVDLFPENFFSLEGLQGLLDVIKKEYLPLTISGSSMEYAVNPTTKEGRWVATLRFDEVPTYLILNKTRSAAMMEMTGSAFLGDWGLPRRIWIRPAILDQNAQIEISAAIS
jgi:hypothetical protein